MPQLSLIRASSVCSQGRKNEDRGGAVRAGQLEDVTGQMVETLKLERAQPLCCAHQDRDPQAQLEGSDLSELWVKRNFPFLWYERGQELEQPASIRGREP